MTTEEIYRTLIKIVKPHNGYTAQLEAIARWVESDFEPKKQGQNLPIHGVSNQRELLIAFFDSVDTSDIKKQKQSKGWEVVDNYLKAIDCC